MKKAIKVLCVVLCGIIIMPFFTACFGNIAITFDTGADAGAIDPLSAKKGDIILEEDIEAPERTGYTFGGWYIDDEKVVFPYTVSKSKTFTAKWIISTYSIIYHLNGGTGTQDRTYTITDLPLTLPTASIMQKTDYTFGGWHANAELTGLRTGVITVSSMGDKELWARWSPTQYSITYNLDGGGWQEELYYPTSYSIESDITILKSPEKSGYFAFAGWYANEGLTGSPVWQIPATTAANVEFWAKWQSVNYKITYHLNGGEHAPGYPQGGNIGTAVTLTAPEERPGQYFAGWYDNEELSGTPVTVISSDNTGNKEFWAKWDLVVYDIVYHLDEENTVSDIYYVGGAVDLFVPDYNASKWFLGWYNNAEFTGNPVTEISAGSTGNKEFWAKWGSRVETDWRMEVEFIDLIGKQGSGWSFTAYEYKMVLGNGPGNTLKASNGYYLSYFTASGTELEFVFNSDKAFAGELFFGMVSEYVQGYMQTDGGFPMNSDNLELWINGEQIFYEPFRLHGELQGTDDFRKYQFVTPESGTMSFIKGVNTVMFRLPSNFLFPGRPSDVSQSAGPNIDYMEIKTDAHLTFLSHLKDNEELIYMQG